MTNFRGTGAGWKEPDPRPITPNPRGGETWKTRKRTLNFDQGRKIAFEEILVGLIL